MVSNISSKIYRSNSPYAQYVQSMVSHYVQLSASSSGNSSSNNVQASQLLPLVKPSGLSEHPTIVILAPHPDDECLMAGAALRMQEEWDAQVIVIPYGYGSNIARRNSRAQELADAVSVLGFTVFDPRKNTRLEVITEIEFLEAMTKLKPEIIFSPHARDFHPAHIGAHDVVERFIQQTTGKKPLWLQTEYWQAMESPQLFIPLRPDHVIQIGEALMKHVGEVSRNPYHLRLPAWYIDQARRAQEIMPGASPGVISDQYLFGQLFRF